MISTICRAATFRGSRQTAGFVGALLLFGCFGMTGCAAVKAVKKVAHDVKSNKATIDAFTTKVKAGEATAFEATYVTTGSSPATIVYAVEPPKNLAFTETPAAGSSSAVVSNLDIIVNSTGEYSCSPPSSGSGASAPWSCQALAPAAAATRNAILDFYTPAHWVGFLRDFALAAGFAGDTVSSSTMTVNGFAMSCVDFQASGVTGTSTICTTAQGILGYVKVAGDDTSFEIKSYSASPPASLFALPPGAKVTAVSTSPAA
jgi:hypothetical protein